MREMVKQFVMRYKENEYDETESFFMAKCPKCGKSTKHNPDCGGCFDCGNTEAFNKGDQVVSHYIGKDGVKRTHIIMTAQM